MKIVAMAMACWLAFGGLADAKPVCHGGQIPVAACFIVHGRLQAWNGAPTFRIWRMGTSRVLGVSDAAGDPWLPAQVQRAFGGNAFGKLIDGDFEVCPLTKQKPAHMQLVCIIAVSHMVVKAEP